MAELPGTECVHDKEEGDSKRKVLGEVGDPRHLEGPTLLLQLGRTASRMGVVEITQRSRAGGQTPRRRYAADPAESLTTKKR